MIDDIDDDEIEIFGCNECGHTQECGGIMGPDDPTTSSGACKICGGSDWDIKAKSEVDKNEFGITAEF